MTKKTKLTFVLGLLMIFLLQTVDTEAQRRRRTRVVQEDQVSLSQKLWYGIHLGNLDFFGNNLSLSGKFAVGYKLNNRFSAGIGGKLFYDFFERQGPNLNLFSYGIGPLVRAKVTREIYVQAEYDITSYELYNNFTFASEGHETFTYPLIGGGYESGTGPWRYGLNILFVLSEKVREPNVKNSIVEWWISFSYNF